MRFVSSDNVDVWNWERTSFLFFVCLFFLSCRWLPRKWIFGTGAVKAADSISADAAGETCILRTMCTGWLDHNEASWTPILIWFVHPVARFQFVDIACIVLLQLCSSRSHYGWEPGFPSERSNVPLNALPDIHTFCFVCYVLQPARYSKRGVFDPPFCVWHLLLVGWQRRHCVGCFGGQAGNQEVCKVIGKENAHMSYSMCPHNLSED